MDESKMMEALPILEKLATQNPKDGEVQFYLGFCIFAKSREIKDPFLHKQERLRARDIWCWPKNWGDRTVLNQVLASIPPDGGERQSFPPMPTLIRT